MEMQDEAVMAELEREARIAGEVARLATSMGGIDAVTRWLKRREGEALSQLVLAIKHTHASWSPADVQELTRRALQAWSRLS